MQKTEHGCAAENSYTKALIQGLVSFCCAQTYKRGRLFVCVFNVLNTFNSYAYTIFNNFSLLVFSLRYRFTGCFRSVIDSFAVSSALNPVLAVDTIKPSYADVLGWLHASAHSLSLWSTEYDPLSARPRRCSQRRHQGNNTVTCAGNNCVT